MLLLMIIYLAFISLGLPDSLLGSAWPVMQIKFDVPLSYMGIVSMIISGGTIFSSLMSDWLNKKLGTHIVVTVSIFLTALALFGFSTSNAFWMLCLWGIPYGLGAGAIDAALNNYIALHYTSRHMSWLHCFWGMGTIISPYIMSYSLVHNGWQSGYRIVSILQCVIAVIVLLSIPLWKIHKKNVEDTAKDVKPIGLKDAFQIKGVPCLLLGFSAYCAAESTVMLWASSYLVRTRGIVEEKAAAFASLFFIGITAGRFLSGIVSEKIGDRNLIRIGTGIIALGIVCVAMPLKIDALALTGFVVIGLGCAPIYPSIIHSTPVNFGRQNSQAIIGIQMASAYIGSTFMAPLFGLIANHISIKLLPYYLVIFIVLMITMVERTFRLVKNTAC
jgi:fucose permease